MVINGGATSHGDELHPEDGMPAPAPTQVRTTHRLWRLAGLVFAVGITVAVYMLRDHLRDAASYGYAGLFLISILGNATIVLPVPTLLTAFLGGGVFNPVLVGIISAAGATLGELTGYVAGLGGQVVVENREIYRRFERWMHRYGLVALFVLAAIPNPFFDVAGIIAGMSRMRVTTFLLVTWAGKIVKFVLIAFAGAGGMGFLERWLGV